MNLCAHQYHSAILHVHFHCSSEGSLGLLGQPFSFMDNQNLEIFSIFRNLQALRRCNFFDNTLNDMCIVVFIIGRGDLNVVVTLIDCKFDIDGGMLGFEDPFLTFEFVDMLSKYLLQESVSASFFASTFRSVKYHVLK